jgi:hypothetical protein
MKMKKIILVIITMDKILKIILYKASIIHNNKNNK